MEVRQLGIPVSSGGSVTDSRDEHEPYGFTESPVIARLQAEIARLTAERDEARRLICNIVSTACSRWSEDVAKDRGWEYLFKEDGK